MEVMSLPGFVTSAAIKRYALIDESGLYRYNLTRTWGSGERLLFIMLNPSTADGERDDATIRRCIGFAKQWKYGAIEVVNLFALRATDPMELINCRYRDGVSDPVGPDNNHHIRKAADRAERIIAAWGSWAKPSFRDRAKAVTAMLRWHEKTLFCLKKSKGGDPCHPVRLPYDCKLEIWEGGH